MTALWLALTVAFADAQVTKLETLNSAGVWRPVRDTGSAVWVASDGSETPLARGMRVPDGATIKTTQARVMLKTDNKNQLTVAEGSRVQVGDRSMLQSLGSVYYKVRGAFSVRYGTVEASVEGTRFVVSGKDNGVFVGVYQGRVRVTDEGREVLLRRDQSVDTNEEELTAKRWSLCNLCGLRHD